MAPVGFHLLAAFLLLALLNWPAAGRRVRSLVPHAPLLRQAFKTWRGRHGPPRLKGGVGGPATSGLRFLSIYPGSDCSSLIRGKTAKGRFVVCLFVSGVLVWFFAFLQGNCQDRQHIFDTLSLYQRPRQLMTLYWAFILDLLSPQKSIVFHYRVQLGHWSVNELLQSLYRGEPDQSIAADKRKTR